MRFGFRYHHTHIIGFAILLFVSFLFSSCTRNSNPTSAGTGVGSLSDPSIKPKVIFTLPGNGGVGPFDIYNPGNGTARPSFVVQFNKLMSTYSLTAGAITCKGFDRPVAVVLHNSTSTVVLAKNERAGSSNNHPGSVGTEGTRRIDKTSGYSDVLEFDIVDSSDYPYGPGVRMTYAVGDTYTVTIDTSLEDINGNHLKAPYTFSFVPEPKFRVISTTPSNGQKDVPVWNGGLWSIYFNSPVSPSVLSKIKISPAIGGSWVYSAADSTSAQLNSADTLQFDHTYTLTVPAGVEDNYGHRLQSDYTATFRTTAFSVISASPSNETSNIPVGTSLYFNLTGPIDTSTVRRSFTVTPPASGNLTFYGYNAASFSFVPTSPLKYSTKYTATLSTGLKAADGTPLSAPYTLEFTTQAFQLLQVSPSDGGTNVSTTQPLYIYFDGPIDTSTVRSSFSITPSVSGNFRPNGTNGFTFIPSNGFALGTTYKVTISTGLKASDGTPLGSPYTFSFTTQPFQVTNTEPANGLTNISPNYHPISVFFNGLYDTASVRSAFSIQPYVSGSFSFNDYPSSPGFNFTPSGPLMMSTTYTVSISTAMKSEGGGNLPSSYRFTFSTIPFNVFISPPDTATDVSRATAINVYCNVPYDTSSVRAAFSISPAVNGHISMTGAANYSPYFAFLPATDTSFAPNMKYTVTVTTALKAASGGNLPKTVTSTFTTGAY